MLLKYFYDPALSQASYLVGCPQTGEAMVIDPVRDITPYLQAAAQEKLQICHVTETHIHADFVSGSRELAKRTGAKLYLSQMGDADWQYGYAQEPNVVLLRNEDRWMVGNLRLEVIHTPGHTPEHIALLMTDTLNASKPVGIFTGDFLFVGDVGRPDLLQELEGSTEGSAELGAQQQFQSIRRITERPDYLQIWPGHRAGSACGKALGAIPSTTLGYEKLFNPAFQFNEEGQFVKWLLEDQPEAPRYFARMKRVNQAGPRLLANLSMPARITRHMLDEQLAAGSQVFDLRAAVDYRRAYLPGTLNIPATEDNFTTYVGWFVDYERPLYLILPDIAKLGDIIRNLRAIGVDHIAGYAGQDVVLGETKIMSSITAHELVARQHTNTLLIVDVRSRSEYKEEHIAGAHNIPLGFLPEHLNQLPQDATIVVHCTSGYRSQIGASFLHATGFDNVLPLQDGREQWSKLFDTVTGI